MQTICKRLFHADRVVRCWGCNASAPNPRAFRAAGWRSRGIRVDGLPFTQVSCPACFGDYGFANLDDSERRVTT